MNCLLCEQPGGRVLARCNEWRIVLADEPDALAFPGFTRVVWNEHRREMSDLSASEQVSLMRVVFAVERLMREHLAPDKVNLASLGNQVAHLHWHVIPRYRSDSHFPAPVWAAAQREPAISLPDGALQAYCDALAPLAD